MRSECIQAVNMAMGRSATQAEKHDIENRLRISMRRKAAEAPAVWASLSGTEKLRQAAQGAATDIEHEAALRRHRAALGILAHDRIQNYVESQVSSGIDKLRITAVGRLLEDRPDGQNNVTSVWRAKQGIIKDAERFMSKSWFAAGGKFLHMFADPKAETLLVRALHGATDVPKEFIEAAKDFHGIVEILRRRFNAAGGDVGKLVNWGMPHSWSTLRLLKGGVDGWTDKMLPLLDRNQYMHDDGSRYTDDEMRAFLDEAWQSVVTNGANKVLGGERVGAGIKANRHSAERQIHLKDADAYLSAMHTFGDRSVLASMFGHIHSMARDIALVEQFGPNADESFKNLLEESAAKDKLTSPQRSHKVDTHSRFYASMYNYIANGDMQALTKIGRFLQGWRNLQALKLGSVLIHSLNDYVLMGITSNVNGIPRRRAWLNHLRLANPADASARRLAINAGLMSSTYAEGLSRYGDEMSTRGWTSKLGNVYVKLTGAPYAWHAKQAGFASAMEASIGDSVTAHAHLADLPDDDQGLLKHSGITEDDWNVMRMAEQDETFSGQHMLTPASIYLIPDTKIEALGLGDPQLVKNRASSHLMAFVSAEQDRAVPMPGARAHIALGGQTDPNTIVGALTHSFRTFLSFPIDYAYQHGGRMLSMMGKRGTAAQGVAYAMELLVGCTLTGALSNAIDNIITGKNPGTLNPTVKDGWENWVSAMTRGGGLGIIGDLLFNRSATDGSSLGEMIEGPQMGDLGNALKIITQTFSQAPADQTARANHQRSLEGERLLRPYVPGTNLWYTRAAFNHLFFNALSDHLSPGYLMRSEANARKYHESYWWEPDQGLPQRAPDLSNVAATQP